MSLFSTKPLETLDAHQPLRVLGPTDLTLLGIGAITGTGISPYRPGGRDARRPAVVLADGYHHVDHRRDRDAGVGIHADQRARRAGQHRHAVRVRDCLDRGDVLRRTRPDLDRPFRTPFVPALPIASARVSLALIAALPASTWQRLMIGMAIGLAIYCAYARRHSQLNQNHSLR